MKKYDSKYTTTARDIVNGTTDVHPCDYNRVLGIILAERDACQADLLMARAALEHGLTKTANSENSMRKACQKINSHLGDRETKEPTFLLLEQKAIA